MWKFYHGRGPAWLAALAVACFIVIAADSPAINLAPAPSLIVAPVLMRVEVAPNTSVATSVMVTAESDAVVMAIETDCRCVASSIPLPLTLIGGVATAIPLRVVGIQAGLKTVTLRTTIGTAQAQVQVVTAGMGQGRDLLNDLLRTALGRQLIPVVIVHDLRGEIRNCGCSAGSLGGLDHLAALPAQVRAQIPGARFVLTGDSDGSRAGVGAALLTHGWSRDDAAIIVTADPLSALEQPGVLAVIPTVPVQANHRRLLIPLVTGGMVAEILLIDAQQQIVEHLRLPIDQTLASDPSVLKRFPEHLSVRIDATASPSASCLSCHAGAHAAWATSRHGAALSSLAPADRVDGCIGCHTTPIASGVVAGGVHCQACHQGGEAHHQSGGQVHTTGTTDCRSCHDSRHHSGFDPVKAWQAITHGR